jgi:hypothetical protein
VDTWRIPVGKGQTRTAFYLIERRPCLGQRAGRSGYRFGRGASSIFSMHVARHTCVYIHPAPACAFAESAPNRQISYAATVRPGVGNWAWRRCISFGGSLHALFPGRSVRGLACSTAARFGIDQRTRATQLQMLRARINRARALGACVPACMYASVAALQLTPGPVLACPWRDTQTYQPASGRRRSIRAFPPPKPQISYMLIFIYIKKYI